MPVGISRSRKKETTSAPDKMQVADDMLLDQSLFTLTSDQYQAFARALENAAPNQRLKQLLASKSPWEI